MKTVADKNATACCAKFRPPTRGVDGAGLYISYNHNKARQRVKTVNTMEDEVHVISSDEEEAIVILAETARRHHRSCLVPSCPR